MMINQLWLSNQMVLHIKQVKPKMFTRHDFHTIKVIFADPLSCLSLNNNNE